MAVSDAKHSAVRHATTRDCFLVLRDATSPLTISEIARATGLSRPTVDAVLQDLGATGLLRTSFPGADGQPGRPARRAALDPSVATIAALDIGARSVRCVLTDLAGDLRARTVTELDREDPVSSLLEAVRSTGAQPSAVGVSVPGIMAADGRIDQSLAVPSLSGLPLRALLEDSLQCPVAVENDIKLAAYTEHHLGSPASGLVYVQIGHRISVALVVGGEILHGSHRLAGELGIQRGMRWTSTSQRGRLTWSTGDQAQPLVERAMAGEAAAQEEIGAFCEEIAPRLAALLLAVDPEVVVIGGGLSRAGETLLGPLRTAIGHQLMITEAPSVIAAHRATDGSLVGALGRAFERGSASLTGVPGIPPPWSRLLVAPAPRSAPDTDRARTSPSVLDRPDHDRPDHDRPDHVRPDHDHGAIHP